LVKTLVIDDELLARENLKILIEDFCEGIEVIGTAGSISVAKQMIEDLKPDLIFLDIRMPSGAEGFDLLDSFETIDFEVVFVTAFKDYAIQAFKANAIDYILKPVEIDELIATSKKIVAQFNQNESDFANKKEIVQNAFKSINTKKVERIAITSQKGMKLISLVDIERLQSNSNYTEIYLMDGSKIIDTKTLKTYQELLPEENFMRVHNSHIINLSRLDEYQNDQGHIVILKSGTQIPVSRTNVSQLINYFKSI
jgi:two-component system LytT family response regulator